MNEIIQEFLVESYENLDQLDQEFVALEENPADRAILGNIFRTIHTLKGTAGFLGLSKLEALAHVGESLLTLLRDGELRVSAEITTALLSMIDAVRQILGHIERTGTEGANDYLELIGELSRLQKAPAARAPAAAKPAPAVTPDAVPQGSGLADADAALEDFFRQAAGESYAEQVEPAVPPAAAVEAEPDESAAAAGSQPADTDDMNEIIQEFLVESYENLDQLDQEFVALEENPADRAILGNIFRTIHTLKGTAGFLGLSKLEALAHVGESLLTLLRDGELRVSAEITTALLSMIDAVRQILGHIERTGTEGANDYLELIGELSRLQKAPAGASDAQPAAAPLPQATTAPAAEAAAKRVEQPVEAVPPKPVQVPPSSAAPRAAKPAEPAPASDEAAPGAQKPASASDQTIRVDVKLLDDLMNLVGELVLARNHILQFVNQQQDSNLIAASQRLNLIASELQEGVMKTRMQPVGNIWNKFPRVVRDLATACNKKVRIEMLGKETELDKTLIETIKDPLTHLVRNAVDHGIEDPQVRRAKGKAEEGCLRLHAYHEGGQVNIEITDDGAGIDVDVVKAKALERGLISAERADSMSEREAVNLIFLPGFSTAKKVTNVSGRGVGMDVVKTNIEKIGGLIDVQNNVGHGTTIKIKIPLTLAIIPALIVVCDNNRYAMPQISLQELVRLEGTQAGEGIESVHGAPVYRLRDKLLPLIRLRQVLGLSDQGTIGEAGDEVVNILVLNAFNQQFGLIVDDVCDTQEIVVKPLGTQLKGIPIYAGATIMGDGSVALILDAMGIAECSNVLARSIEREAKEREIMTVEQSAVREPLIVVRGPDDGRMAVPLNMIERLEILPASLVEDVGGNAVIQYRGEILPLIDLSDVLPERRKWMREGTTEPAVDDVVEKIHVLVYQVEDRSVGLRVDRILDIVDQDMSVLGGSSRDGVSATVVIKDRVTELLDIEAIMQGYDVARYGKAVARGG